MSTSNKLPTLIMKNGDQFFIQMGNRIFYFSNEKGNFDIYFYNITSGTSEYVIGTEGDDWDVDISSCGNFLVFAAKKGGDFHIMFYDLTTKELRQLTNSTGNQWDPRFSSNDKLITYAQESNNTSSIKLLTLP